jgi:Sensors of blue-light using FAD
MIAQDLGRVYGHCAMGDGVMSLVHLVYVSRAQIGATAETCEPLLDHLITSARHFNFLNGITGYLMFDGVEFAQILEGTEGAVMGTFLRIASDRKHDNVTVLGRGAIAARRFEKWEMGLAVRHGPLAAVFTRNGFLRPGTMSQKPLEPVLNLAMQLSRRQAEAHIQA